MQLFIHAYEDNTGGEYNVFHLAKQIDPNGPPARVSLRSCTVQRCTKELLF